MNCNLNFINVKQTLCWVTDLVCCYLKKPKNYIKGQLPIYLRITIDAVRIELSTQRDCLPSRWNIHSGRVNRTKEDSKSLNVYLDLSIAVCALRLTLVNIICVITMVKELRFSFLPLYYQGQGINTSGSWINILPVSWLSRRMKKHLPFLVAFPMRSFMIRTKFFW